MNRGKGWRRQGCYVWRVRKPHAPLGLPLIGRHFGYLGQSSSFYHRDRQHGGLDSRVPASSWSDLAPKRYPLPCLFPRWRWSRELSETLWTALLCPVYSIEKQPPWNLRKIGRAKALRQRAAREVRRRRLGWKRHSVDILVTLARLGVGAALIFAALLILMKASA